MKVPDFVKDLSAEQLGNIVAALAFPALLLLGFAISAFEALVKDEPQLEIVAYLDEVAADTSILRGRVLDDSGPVKDPKVWAVVSTARGARYSPPPAESVDTLGGFVIQPVPASLAGEAITEAVIHAQTRRVVQQGERRDTLVVSGDEVLTLVSGEGSVRRVTIPMGVLAFLPAIFLVSLLIPMWGEIGPVRYGSSVLLAFLFTVGMIGSISVGLSYVNTTGEQGQVLSLGFASIFEGSYVEDGAMEWLFSLTSLHEVTREDGSSLVRGFGAPLWVILLAVIGAGLLTVSIIVREIRDKRNYSAQDDVRRRIEKIVRHQFFILFAPFGAVFVYQGLVAAEAASQPLAVAFAALGAGASLNVLLDRAVSKSKQLLEKQDTSEGEEDGGEDAQPPGDAGGNAGDGSSEPAERAG